MINLMPPDLKSGYMYARRNVSLRKWAVLFLVAIVGLGALATYGLLSIKQSTVHNDNQITKTEATFKEERSVETQKQVQDISNNFKLAVKVLSQEVLFSQLIKQVGATIPNNANLTGLTINQTQGGIDISANATDYKTATQVQVNLADPKNKIFSKADIVSITCGNEAGSASYPCTVNIRALFAGNNPFLFINNRAGAP
jgi:hypothetical protein